MIFTFLYYGYLINTPDVVRCEDQLAKMLDEVQQQRLGSPAPQDMGRQDSERRGCFGFHYHLCHATSLDIVDIIVDYCCCLNSVTFVYSYVF